MSYLAPASDRDTLQISGYSRWEQAFRVYSNVITGQYPGKVLELLQYNHTIHMASTSYFWENVYSYDREFRQHIARHPQRPWNVILQQALTMLLKDRFKNENSFFQKGGRHTKSNKEPCKRFNKGRCTYGASCRYDHRCTVPKCGKFGHGAYVCHLRNSDGEGGRVTSSNPVQESYNANAGQAK